MLRQMVAWPTGHVGADLVTQLAVHRPIVDEKPGQIFCDADGAAPARVVDKGDAMVLFDGAGNLARLIDGNAESLRTTVDRAFIGNRLKRGIFGTGNRSKNCNNLPKSG